MPREDLLFGALAGALIVVSGALYALLFALGKLYASRISMYGAYLAYCALIGFSLLLLRALDLAGLWVAVVIVMLAGYFVAPKAIWHLCLGTHGEDQHDFPGNSKNELAKRPRANIERLSE